MDLISRYTCIRFVERTSTTATDYNLKHNGALLLLPGGNCASYVGRIGGNQTIYCCEDELCVHELGHAMGQLHEQTSSLRYGHLRINWPSVPSDLQKEYISRARTTLVGFYDTSTYMHYPDWWGPMTLDAPTIEFLDHKPFYMMKRSHSCTSVQLGTALRLLIATLKVMPSPCLGHGMELVSVSVMMVWTQRPDARPLPLKWCVGLSGR
ncbi:zinc metalloproteinase nas-6-like [Pomacea canaliculata]|uniref:zinc metalloproteinase nas-6-like n=1 Tax=Pomacea canaliculata TaxID=400727 RepID=UPI000D73982A|nr:zinc metalloproteinase nas-6-like [Pomacea canaliculata]XP_025096364.1 zinc metalloproteinase nas-6-like [Pomacea canaliculata]